MELEPEKNAVLTPPLGPRCRDQNHARCLTSYQRRSESAQLYHYVASCGVGVGDALSIVARVVALPTSAARAITSTIVEPMP